MGIFAAPLARMKAYAEIKNAMEAGQFPVSFTGCADSQKGHLIANIGENYACRLVLTWREEKARELYEDLAFFDRGAVLYPAKDVLFYSADVHSNHTTVQRMRILKKLREGDPVTIVASLDAVLERRVPKEEFFGSCLRIDEAATRIDLPAFRTRLVEMGYESNGLVQEPGEFGVRGGIIDIFPLTEENPVRIELWGDEIDSIRYFDPESQRSVDRVDAVDLYPASEILLPQDRMGRAIAEMKEEYEQQAAAFKKAKQNKEKERLRKMLARTEDELTSLGRAVGPESLLHYFYGEDASLLDYLPEDTLVVLDEPRKISERGEACEQEFSLCMEQRLAGGYILPGQARLLYSYEEMEARLQKSRLLLLSGAIADNAAYCPKREREMNTRSISSYNNSFEQLIKDLARWKKEKYQMVLLSSSVTRARRLSEDIRDCDLPAYFSENVNREPGAGEIMVAAGRLKSGFEYPEEKYVVLSEQDIFKQKKTKKRRKTQHGGEKIRSLAEISVGDYVVHERYGLGIYRGMEKIESEEGVTRDYINIEYKDESNLFIPASQLELIQKYSNINGKKPKLNRLGGSEWEKTKSRVRSQVQIAAKDLVELYAQRQAKAGYPFGPDTVWQTEFEELFPYEETEDQLAAIEDVKRDMESTKIMDRLICGDVGYGKTEIAIRAAFKAVMDSKQVVFLVPTTILAQQHYNTFVERMRHYPINIRMLSRFCTQREVSRIQTEAAKGSVDIVIGTHKVLSKKMQFRNLGLLIIDEEQRFGVKQKEKIKQMKKDVDVLALSATPIPRTLHMSLSGIRDMSVLEEAPVDRRAVQTYVLEYNEELVREAIARELARDGQVYYVYNRVEGIEETTERLQRLVPEARVEFAHGQMDERVLENIMADFINREIDVLVSTTIIETGLDIPNANTMIVHDAQNFGLSQLYQLRGRVGRSNRTAYAFLMYGKNRILKEEAEKRLKAIREFTDLGSGFKIAMRDLEIRGAGNLLGAAQSGHMESVGYDLYCKMLSEAIAQMKGEQKEEDAFHTVMDVSIDAFIPAEYIKSETEKLSMYKRIALVETEEEYEDMVEELTDRFGDVPAPVLRLLEVALLRAEAHRAWILSVEQKDKTLAFTMNPAAKVQVEKIDGFLKKYGRRMRIRPGASPVFSYDLTGVPRKEITGVVRGVVASIRELLE